MSSVVPAPEPPPKEDNRLNWIIFAGLAVVVSMITFGMFKGMEANSKN
jgi:hypothetical protein